MIKEDSSLAGMNVYLFSKLPTAAFGQPVGPYISGSKVESTAYTDCYAYYALVCELYYKVRLILEYLEYEETGKCYKTYYHGFKEIWMELTEAGCHPTLVDAYTRVTTTFLKMSALYMAHLVIPKGGGFTSVNEMLDYLYKSADILFYLVYSKTVKTYLSSNYPLYASTESIVEGYDALLSAYLLKVENELERGC